MRALAANCKKLREIDFSCCVNLSDEAVEELARGCKLLQKVDMHNCMSLSSVAVISLVDNCQNINTIIATECPFIPHELSKQLYKINVVTNREDQYSTVSV